MTSPKHMRPDQNFIVEYVESNTSVLDVGCGAGQLLLALEAEKQVYGHGLEHDSESVAKALADGLMVIQGDGDVELQHYPDHAFDYSILSLTLQAMKQPKEVLKQSLRIAKECIVVIPNFGHYKNRLHLALKGTMPVTKTLQYQWYETPNIHFCTIRDFVALIEEVGATCITARAVHASGRTKHLDPARCASANLRATHAVFVLKQA